MNNSVPSWGYAVMIAALVAVIALIVFYVKRNHGFKRPLFASPYVIWIIIFTVVPCLIVAYYSFTHTVAKSADESEKVKIEEEYSIVIHPAHVKVTAEDKYMQAGAEMPELTVVVEGCSFCSEQTVKKSIINKYKPVCRAGDVPGEYEIVFDQQYVDEGNYDITFVNGKLTVFPEGDSASLCTKSLEKTYDGQALMSTVTCSVKGSVIEYSTDNGETWSEKVPSVTDAGTVEIQVRAIKDGTEIASGSYTLSVKPAEAEILILNQTFVTGSVPETFENAKCIGLTNRDKINKKNLETDANPGTKPGDYEITVKNPVENDGNYHFTVLEGTLRITEAYETGIASTGFEQVYNGKPIVPTDYAFLNREDRKLTQVVYKLDDSNGEYVEITGTKNISDVGSYKVVNTAVSDTVMVTEFTLDNFIAFGDSNYNAREDMKRVLGNRDDVSLGKLDERGNENLIIFGRSLWMAFLCTVICLLIGYPAAYIMADREFKLGSTIIILFIVPMWMNFLLRTIAMMAILDDDGVINTVLQWLGLPQAKLMYNSGAVLLGMVYNFLPFMVFPIYNVLNKMDVKLSEAAMDLGCNKFLTFEKVTLPLSVPGIVSGITMVFMPAVTTFYISGLLGGGNYTMFGDLIESKFISGSLSTWNEGSALSLIMMVLILISIGLLRKVDPEGEGGAV